MKKNSVRAIALSAAAVLAFGVSAPATFAKPATDHGAAAGHGRGHADSAPGKAAHTATAHAARTDSAHGKAAAHKLTAAGNQLEKVGARLDRALVQVVSPQHLHGIDPDSAAKLQANAAADTLLVDQAVAAAKTALTTGSTVREERAALHKVRPEGYLTVESLLRRAAELQTQLDALAPAPAPTTTDPATTDPSTPTSTATPTIDTAALSAAIDAAVGKALAWSAFDGKAPLAEVRTELNSVEDVLAPTDTTDQPDGTDPVEGADPADAADPADGSHSADPADGTGGGTTSTVPVA